jgi:Flp pilus assembly protein TadG
MRGNLRKLAGTRGATLVESAIVLPLLLLLTFAAFDFGGLFYVYLALQNGVSQATRFGITGNLMPNMSREDSIRTAMRNNTPTLTLANNAFRFSHMSPGGGAWVNGTGAPDDIEKLTVDYTWRPLTPLLTPFFTNGRLDLSVESSMKNEPRVD